MRLPSPELWTVCFTACKHNFILFFRKHREDVGADVCSSGHICKDGSDSVASCNNQTYFNYKLYNIGVKLCVNLE